MNEEDRLDIKRQAVNEVAAEQLPMLTAELEEAMADKDLLEQYEIDFLGDLYARMIVSVYMGYYPNRMAEDADGARDRRKQSPHRLHEMAKEHDNG